MKIDKAFIDGVTGGPDQSALVRAVIQLAHTFDMKTVAEGIEREDQRRALQVLGSDFGQGYLFSRPLDAESLEALLRKADVSLPAIAGHVHEDLRHLRALPS